MTQHPLLNIHFCGSSISAARQDIASLAAVRQFRNTLILAGVGSETTYDAQNKEWFPTPGTFDVDSDLRRQPRHSFFYRHFSNIDRLAGLLWGHGEEESLNFAMAHVRKKMSHISASEQVLIKLSGTSRGACAMVSFANMVYQEYSERIIIELFLIDPNAGIGRQHDLLRRHIPPNVSRMYVTFNCHEPIIFFKALPLSHYFITSHHTSLSAMYVEGGHLEQELFPSHPKQQPESSARITQHLLELFYASNDDARAHRPVITTVLTAKIKRGFVCASHRVTALDHFIERLVPYEYDCKPYRADEHQDLVRLRREVQDNRLYDEFHYQVGHFLNRLTHQLLIEHDVPHAALMCNITYELIRAMTPSLQQTAIEKKVILTRFEHQATQYEHQYWMRHILAPLTGFVWGMSVGLVTSVGAFLIGFMPDGLYGALAIPSMIIGAYYGFLAGFHGGVEFMLAPQCAHHVVEATESLLRHTV
jgi:hypothetical protein